MSFLSLLFSGLWLGMVFLSPLAQAQTKTLVSRFNAGPIKVDPKWPLWEKVPAVKVPLLAQAIARPLNLTPSVTSLTAKSVHNGTWIAFLISWKDNTRDVTMYTDKFRDAVAIQMPIAGKTDVPMGKPGGRVLILHWKADWQEDIDKAFMDIPELYPNFWIDWYPFVTGEPPHGISHWSNLEAQRYMTGWVLGNPRSQPFKRVSVEEQTAEGFGSLTSNPSQSAAGKGVYDKGEWKVVIARPFASGDPNDPAWGPGRPTTVAFAAWDGGKGEIGSRKSFSDWVTLRITPVGR